MQALQSFAYSGTISAGSQAVTISGEFQAPNRLHELVTASGHQLDFIVIGSATYERQAPATTYSLVANGSNGTTPTDPRTIFLLLSNLTDVSQNGSDYSFSISGAGANTLIAGSTLVRGTVKMVSGRAASLSYSSNSPAVASQIAYSQFNSATAVPNP